MLTDEQITQRLRSALERQTKGIEPPPGLLASIHQELLAPPRVEGRGRWRRASIRGPIAAVAAAAAIAVAVFALTAIEHNQSAVAAPPIVVVPAKLPAAAKLPLGAPAGPQKVNPNTFQGAAIPGTVRLAAEAADPRGGLPWGLRTFQTTRGQTCLQVGRVQDGTIGVIGQDNAWGNDHRFHPIAPNAYTADSCSQTDRHGNVFNNVSIQGATASADVPFGTGRQGGECRIGEAPSQDPPCATADLRDLDYGLLGPAAVGITYLDASGHQITEPTSGHNGAYLVVRLPTPRPCQLLKAGGRSCVSGGSGRTSSPELQSGVITSVTYSDGHTCQLPAPTPAGVQQASCPPVGYAAPRVEHVTPAQTAAPITVRKLPAGHYCTSGPLRLAPCQGGQTPLRGERGLLLVEISFTARVAVTNGNSDYEYSLTYPARPGEGCPGSGSSGTTLANLRGGTRVVFQDQIPDRCTGIVHGTVAYVPTTGAAGFGAGPTLASAQGKSIPVGRFSFRTP
jgi:hypothetical protein